MNPLCVNSFLKQKTINRTQTLWVIGTYYKMKKGISMNRTNNIKVRVSKVERQHIDELAAETEMTISDLIRHRLLKIRLRNTNHEKELLRQVARIGSNINQIARWANIHKNRTPSLETVLLLNRIYEEVKALKKGKE